MLKKLFHCFVATSNRGGKSPSRKNIGGSSLQLVDVSLQTKDLNVRIIHAGGLVELYQNAIIAYEVIEKYPGMQLSRPEIFKQPHESFIHPYERLLPGQKFYLVPSSTVRKLKRNHSRMEGTVSRKSVLFDDSDSSSFEHSFRSAKDFFLSRCALSTGEREAKKPFKPPIKKPRLTKGIGWQPCLNSIEEVSP